MPAPVPGVAPPPLRLTASTRRASSPSSPRLAPDTRGAPRPTSPRGAPPSLDYLPAVLYVVASSLAPAVPVLPPQRLQRASPPLFPCNESERTPLFAAFHACSRPSPSASRSGHPPSPARAARAFVTSAPLPFSARGQCLLCVLAAVVALGRRQPRSPHASLPVTSPAAAVAAAPRLARRPPLSPLLRSTPGLAPASRIPPRSGLPLCHRAITSSAPTARIERSGIRRPAPERHCPFAVFARPLALCH
nr:vegetative cell wall protein gp1-like [Aegilops tauschii subsp. strangulata]